MFKTYKLRLYPNEDQKYKLEYTLSVCKNLYNDMLSDRVVTYKESGVGLNYYDQASLLKYMSLDIYLQVAQDVLRRLDKTYKAFFRRVQNKETPGFPRFKSWKRYDSFTYPDNGFKIINDKLRLSKIGEIKINQHRMIIGKIKICTIKREVDQWYVILSVETPDKNKQLKLIKKIVGVDVGLNALITLSNGDKVSPHRHYRQSEEKLAIASRKLSKKTLGSNNRNKQRLRVGRIHRKIKNQRKDFNHKLSRKLVNAYDVIVFEQLRITNMVRNSRLAKSIHDASWGQLIQFTNYKAEEAGKEVVLVDPKNTSQNCSKCGNGVPKDLSVRIHDCPYCGLKLDRDHNAAINIMQRAGTALFASGGRTYASY